MVMDSILNDVAIVKHQKFNNMGRRVSKAIYSSPLINDCIEVNQLPFCINICFSFMCHPDMRACIHRY